MKDTRQSTQHLAHRPAMQRGDTHTISLGKDLLLHVSKMPLINATDLAHTLYTYSVFVQDVSLVEVKLDFSKAVNLKVEHSGPIVTAEVGPLKTQVVALVRAFDREWTTECEVSVEKRSPPLEVQRELISAELQKV